MKISISHHLKSPFGLFRYFAPFINHKSMFLLSDLTEKGYLQIKKDRELLIGRISQLQGLVDEMDLALPFLKSIYEPEIKIKSNEKDGFFYAWSVIPASANNEKLVIKLRIGKISDYKYGEKDPSLVERGNELVRQYIRNSFPLHFK